MSPQPPWVKGEPIPGDALKQVSVPIRIKWKVRSPFSPVWTMSGGAGSILPGTETLTEPKHVPPSSPGTGYLRLSLDYTGRTLTSPLPMDRKLLRIFPDNLARDMENSLRIGNGPGGYMTGEGNYAETWGDALRPKLADGTEWPYLGDGKPNRGIGCEKMA